MKMYNFVTRLNVKPQDDGKYWISDYIPDHVVNTDTLDSALYFYFDFLRDNGIEISKTAQNSVDVERNALDPDQMGHITITGKTLFSNRSDNLNVEKYIDVTAFISAYIPCEL